MPAYEYECQKCGERFQVNESFSEHDRQKKHKCPDCGSKDARQLLESVHVKTSKKS